MNSAFCAASKLMLRLCGRERGGRANKNEDRPKPDDRGIRNRSPVAAHVKTSGNWWWCTYVPVRAREHDAHRRSAMGETNTQLPTMHADPVHVDERRRSRRGLRGHKRVSLYAPNENRAWHGLPRKTRNACTYVAQNTVQNVFCK